LAAEKYRDQHALVKAKFIEWASYLPGLVGTVVASE